MSAPLNIPELIGQLVYAAELVVKTDGAYDLDHLAKSIKELKDALELP